MLSKIIPVFFLLALPLPLLLLAGCDRVSIFQSTVEPVLDAVEKAASINSIVWGEFKLSQVRDTGRSMETLVEYFELRGSVTRYSSEDQDSSQLQLHFDVSSRDVKGRPNLVDGRLVRDGKTVFEFKITDTDKEYRWDIDGAVLSFIPNMVPDAKPVLKASNEGATE